MNVSTLLEIVLILVTIYLIYSLLTTTLVEMISSVFRLRARELRKGIRRMLQDKNEGKFVKVNDQELGMFHSVIRLFDKSYNDKELVKRFFDEPGIKYLGKSSANSTPSYIQANVFSSALINILSSRDDLEDEQAIQASIGYTEFSNKLVAMPSEEVNQFIESLKNLPKNEQEKAIEDWLVENATPMDTSALESVEYYPEELTALYQQYQEQDSKKKGSFNEKLSEWFKNKSALQIDAETRRQLCKLYKEAKGDKEQFIKKIEQWYDQSMERVTGWFKRRMAYLSFAIGIFLAFFFNVDTIHIANTLKNETAIRASLANFATSYADSVNVDSIYNEHAEKVRANAFHINEALALSDYKNIRSTCCMEKKHQHDVGRFYVLFPGLYKVFNKSAEGSFQSSCINRSRRRKAIMGWIITAIALSFGAPFWFDLLNKLVRLRSSLPPAKTAEPVKAEGNEFTGSQVNNESGDIIKG